MNNVELTGAAVSKGSASPSACPRCGGAVQTLDKPWLGIVAGPVIAYGGIVALFVVGGLLGAAMLAWPVSCRACGRLRLKELPAGLRARVIAKKIFVALLLVAILLAGRASLLAWQAIQTR
jgi:hypothetical protein